MEKRLHAYAHKSPGRRGTLEPGVLAFGLWIRLAVIGAGAVIAGLVMLFDGDSSPVAALTTFLVGSAVATFASLRVRAFLTRVEPRAADKSDSTAPAHARRTAHDGAIEPGAAQVQV